MSGMDRRQFCHDAMQLGASVAGVALLSGACGLIPSRPAQRMPRIGYLSPGPREAFAELVDAFLAGLGDLGYIEGQTLAIEWRFTPQGSDAQFVDMAADLVQMRVDLILASNSTPAAQAARQATDTIPIVAIVARPLAAGLVHSLAQPGGNLTALAASPTGFASKKMELLREIVPSLARVAVLVDATNPVYNPVIWEETLTGAEQVGVQLERIDLRSAADLAAAFESIALAAVDAVVGVQNPLLLPVRAQLGELALQHRLPSAFEARDYVAAGVMMAYAPNYSAISRRAAVYVDKILRGAKPADLPVEQPTTFDFVVNVHTLQSLGLTIPATVLPLVTEWIQ